jgi:hypothetical protein
LKQRNNVLPQLKEKTSTMSDQRRRGTAWVERGLNRVNVVMRDMEPVVQHSHRITA